MLFAMFITLLCGFDIVATYAWSEYKHENHSDI